MDTDTSINFVASTQESREQSNSIVTIYLEQSPEKTKEEELKLTLDQFTIVREQLIK